MLQNRETRETSSRSAISVSPNPPTATFKVKLQDNKLQLELDPNEPQPDVSQTDGDIYINWTSTNADTATLVFQADNVELAGLRLTESTVQPQSPDFACWCDSGQQMVLELNSPVSLSDVYSLTVFVVESSGLLRQHDPKIYNQGPK